VDALSVQPNALVSRRCDHTNTHEITHKIPTHKHRRYSLRNPTCSSGLRWRARRCQLTVALPATYTGCEHSPARRCHDQSPLRLRHASLVLTTRNQGVRCTSSQTPAQQTRWAAIRPEFPVFCHSGGRKQTTLRKPRQQTHLNCNRSALTAAPYANTTALYRVRKSATSRSRPTATLPRNESRGFSATLSKSFCTDLTSGWSGATPLRIKPAIWGTATNQTLVTATFQTQRPHWAT
jgi:hypothetical protein